MHRGDWLVAPDLHGPATRLDVRLRLLPSEPGPLRHRTPVQVHLGAAAVAGRVLLLDGTSLEPGAEGLAQLTLDAPLGALGGDRYVLRDVSARRTLGGGRVVDPFGPRRGLRSPNRRALLEALSEPDDARALSQALAGAEGGIDLDHFRHVRNVAPAAEAPCSHPRICASCPVRRAGWASRASASTPWRTSCAPGSTRFTATSRTIRD
ncbi:hypothetical protein ACFQWF_15425 [Methylorubrum suomiense]